MFPLISIIVPIYNAEKYLTRCLDSLISQRYTHIEIILINDGSTDNSSALCDKYATQDSRIKVLHKENAGVSEARNSGLAIASGDYIHFTDADDWVEPDAYKKLADIVIQREYDVVRFNAFNSSNTIVNQVPFQGEYENKKLEEVMLTYIGAPKLGGTFILGVPWLYLFNRKLIEKNHIRFNKSLRRCEDRLFTLTTLLYSQKVLFIDDILYHYETNEGSLSNKYDSLRWEQEILYLAELRKEYSKIKPELFSKEADKRINNEYLLRAITSINNEFFSDNQNGFFKRYRNTKAIVNSPQIKQSIQNIQKEKLGFKGDLIVSLIKHRQSFLLSFLNTIILYKNKI
jgi:glycosyltransferase EpsJ